MAEILIAMASWLAINLITWLSWKTWVSKTYVSVLLCILVWVCLYIWQVVVKKYPAQWDEIVAFAGWAYAMSQVCYNLYQKFVEEKETKKTSKTSKK